MPIAMMATKATHWARKTSAITNEAWAEGLRGRSAGSAGVSGLMAGHSHDCGREPGLWVGDAVCVRSASHSTQIELPLLAAHDRDRRTRPALPRFALSCRKGLMRWRR